MDALDVPHNFPEVRSHASMEGMILLDKASGITSAQAVQRVRCLLPRGTKVGHAGTLDRFASGLLILLIGRSTRLSETVMSWPKTYLTSIRLDMSSPSQDPDTPSSVVYPGLPKSPEEVESVLRGFIGSIEQVPPDYSALKIGGKRASDRFRAGEAIQLPARTVQISDIQILRYQWPELHLQIDCGRGTYIRAIARDLGIALKTGGMLTALRRTRIGALRVEEAMQHSGLSPEILSRLVQKDVNLR